MRWTADFTDPFTFLSMYRSNDSYNDNKNFDPYGIKRKQLRNVTEFSGKTIVAALEDSMAGNAIFILTLRQYC